MKIILINSFNKSKYIKNALNLSKQLESTDFVSVVVYGGSSQFHCLMLSEKKWVISISENLSDNNAFYGFEKAFRNGFFRKNVFRDATYVYIHDTCKITDSFVKRINELPKIKGWMFAHIYGLYNIGVCDQLFVLTRGNDFKNTTFLPKDESIKLEQGESVYLNGNEIKPLIYYSKRTLSTVITCDLSKCDFMTLNAVKDSDDSKRYVSFIGSLGIYKYVGSHVTYFVPIWASRDHEVRNMSNYLKMKSAFSEIQLSILNNPVGSINPWISLPPYTEDC